MSFILMGLGPFRFSIEGFGYESLKRKLEARIEEQKIVGGRPSLHMTGLGVETLSLRAKFFPKHLPNNRGLSQLTGLRAAVGSSHVLVGNRVAVGDMFGRWAVKSVSDDQTEIFIDGVGQQVEVEIELLYDGPGRSQSVASVIARLFG